MTFLKRDLLPDLHGHLCKALGLMSFAMAMAGHCHSTRVALAAPGMAAPGMAAPASVRRRWERLLDNRHLSVPGIFQRLCRSLASAWSGRRVVLIIDETARDGRLNSLRIAVGYRRRTLPLLSVAYPSGRPPMPLPRLLVEQLSLVHRWLGDALEVTVLTDRGLAWPVLVRLCRRFGWHFVLRLQGSTCVRIDQHQQQQQEQSLRDLAPRRGGPCFHAAGRVFKKRRAWLPVQVTAVWEQRCAEPWLLISDLPGGYARCRSYCKRMWCEQSFRDEKSEGFHWDRSRVDNIEHANRLLLIMALATLLCIASGVQVVKRGLRHLLDPHQRRRLSYFQLGLRWLEWTEQQRAVPVLPISLVPP